MRILAAFDKCKDSLSADDLCSLAEERIKSRVREVTLRKIPQTDGGEGFASILTRSASGEMRTVRVLDSLGRSKEIEVGLLDAASLSQEVRDFLCLGDSGRIVLIEMASIVGLADLQPRERNPWETCTFGVGECLRESLNWNVSAILLGIGGSSTNDMGVGALGALGVRFIDGDGRDLDFPSPSQWGFIKTIDHSTLIDLPPVKIACDVNNPLLGKNGATWQFGLQKGLKTEDQEQLEEKMVSMAALLKDSFAECNGSENLPGMGAAGGIGFGLSLASEVSMVGGFSLVSKWFELEREISDSDLVLSGEGRFDRTSLQGKGPCEILRLGAKHQKRGILLAGSVEKEAALRFRQENPLIEVHAFGRQDLSLEENLLRSEELFLAKLDEVMMEFYSC